MIEDEDKLTPEERRVMRDPLFVFAAAVHAKLGHEGRFVDCREDICIQACGALDSLKP